MPCLPRFRPAALAAVLLIALPLSACGGAEQQIRDGLISAGMAESMATCMAKPMAKQLNLNQLLKLRSLGRVTRLDPRNTSYNELLRHLRALGDPDILRIASSAALGCAFGI